MTSKPINVGVSWLRTLCSTNLRDFNENRRTAILHDRAEPIAVLVSYDEYLRMQEAIDVN
jgi:hypothetical protein